MRRLLPNDLTKSFGPTEKDINKFTVTLYMRGKVEKKYSKSYSD
jgi:hypothetical protein